MLSVGKFGFHKLSQVPNDYIFNSISSDLHMLSYIFISNLLLSKALSWTNLPDCKPIDRDSQKLMKFISQKVSKFKYFVFKVLGTDFSIYLPKAYESELSAHT